jgi:hypothetical protein
MSSLLQQQNQEERRIELATEDLKNYYRNLILAQSKENAAIITNYSLAVKTEINPSLNI